MSLYSIWREVGLILSSIALFLLPWFLDLHPPAGRNPAVTGVEFLTHGAWPMILAYVAIWLGYSVSRFSEKKWASMIFLVAAWVLYIYVYLVYAVIAGRFDRPGFPLGRGHGLMDVRFPALIGVWVNWLGLILLTTGVYLAETGRGRTAVAFAIVGGCLGLGLLVGYFFLLEWLPDTFYHLIFWPVPGPEKSWLWAAQLLGLPIAGAMLGAWIGLRKRPY